MLNCWDITHGDVLCGDETYRDITYGDVSSLYHKKHLGWEIAVSHPGKGGCADPVNEDAILEGVGVRPPGRNRKRQLASDTGDGKT
jgi:hypothetical protein